MDETPPSQFSATPIVLDPANLAKVEAAVAQLEQLAVRANAAAAAIEAGFLNAHEVFARIAAAHPS